MNARILKDDSGAREESREDMVRSIIEKRTSLVTYVPRGLARAEAEGLDLDTF